MVCCGGPVECREPERIQPLAQLRRRRSWFVRRFPSGVVDLLEQCRGVLGEDLNVAALQGGEDDLASTELELPLDRDAGILEDLGEDVAENLLLVEVRRSDGNVARAAGR